jgi:recombination protein RecR
MKLPTIGAKTAQRLALHIVYAPLNEIEELSVAILEARQKTKRCATCFNLAEAEECEICRDPSRSREVLCVVGEAKDVAVLERTREFQGRYHILEGVLSPLSGIGPEQLRIKELLNRIARNKDLKEIIIATDPNVEGEATALYLAKLLQPLGLKISRLAYGLPMGTNIEYADEITLSRSLEGRRDFSFQAENLKEKGAD